MLRQAILTNSQALRSAVGTPIRTNVLRQIRQDAPISRLPLRQAVARPMAIRWYSAETSKPEEAKEAKEGAPEAEDPLAELKKKFEAKEKEAIDLKDKYLRSVAEFRNLQERTTREMKAARDFAIQKFARDLVDSVDNLDRALTMVPADKLKPDDEESLNTDLLNLYEGIKMTENILMSTLEKHGLTRFNPEGEKFNPNEHDATFLTPNPSKEDNTVFHVEQKGFKLNGRVLRAAKVGVVKNT